MHVIYNDQRIKELMMFHNKKLSNGDIVWGYEPKGKRLAPHSIVYKEGAKNTGYFHEGTGKVIAKYKVVEVKPRYKSWDKVVSINVPVEEFEHWDDTSTCFGMCAQKEYVNNKYKDYNFLYKLEKISDVSMELSEFASYSKLNKVQKEFNKHGIYESKATLMREGVGTLTRYNRLTQVILRSDER